MKTPAFFLCSILLLCLAPHLHADRMISPLLDDWRFTQKNAELTAATGDWERVTLPHTWNAVDGQLGKVRNPGEPEGYYRGACWYERSLKIPSSWQGRRVFIRFEAASLVAKTYLNGELLGEHRGGFTAFCYELTPLLRFGGTNDLRVQVDNSHQEDVPPLSGDFNVDGGLYRPAELIVTDAVCISPLDFASPGVYLTTKLLEDSNATVEMKTLVSNGAAQALPVKLEAEITDASGKSVATLASEQTIASGKTEPVETTIKVPNPHLWNARKDPYLYQVKVKVSRDGKVVDEVTQPLGIRTVALSQDRGFLLNGKPYPIHGVNRHQDFKDKGWAMTPAEHEEDAKLMLEMGVTAVRLAHYPQSEYFHDLCDRNGLLLWNEVSLVNTIRDTPEFAANAEQQLRELILQRYNHPSVAFWGMFNELENQKTPKPDALLERLKAVIHELDPSRIDVGASDHNNRPYNQIPTGICFNCYPGWYGKGRPEDIAKTIDDRAAEVGRRIALSEYGGGGNPFQHEEGPPQKVNQAGQFHPEEWQDYLHETEWAAIQNNPKLWGSFLWVMFDFPSARRNEGGQPGLNDKGLVTQDRKVKKDAFFFYKANWNPAPMVYLASRRSTPRQLAETAVKVYSNCGEVELKVNGKSLGRMKPDAVKIARWPKVELQMGNNQVEAIGYGEQGQVTDACDWELVKAVPEAAPEATTATTPATQ